MLQAPATREFEVGRPSGGLLLFVKKRPKKDTAPRCLDISKYWIRVETLLVNSPLITCLVYLSPNLDVENSVTILSEKLNAILTSKPNTPTLILGDFNARIGLLNQLDEDSLENPRLSSSRSSLDTITNKQGTRLTQDLEMMGLVAINGRTRSDCPAQYTFVYERGCSTIVRCGWPISD